jgi:hypothetical protein
MLFEALMPIRVDRDLMLSPELTRGRERTHGSLLRHGEALTTPAEPTGETA